MSSVGNRTKPGLPVKLSRRAWFRAIGAAAVLSTATALPGCAPVTSPAAVQLLATAPQASPSPSAVAPSLPPKNLTTLQFWTQWGDHTRAVWESLLGDFQRTHPTIAIESSYFSLSQLQQSVLLAAANGTLPDLWINAAMVLPEFTLDGVVASLNSLGPVPSDFYPATNPGSVRAGQRWGVPNNGGVPVFWYNVDQFIAAGLDPNTPPVTWDDLLRYGKELTDARKETWGLIVPNRHYPWTAECWYGFLLEAGGDIFAPNQQDLTFNHAPGIEALTFWASLFQTQRTAPLKDLDADSLIDSYGTGAIGMFPAYSVETSRITRFPFPTRNTPYPKNRQRGTHFAGNYTTISARSRHPLEAYTWCAWWWQPEINAAWCSGTGALPARSSSAAHPLFQSYVSRNPLIKASIDSLPFAQAMPARPGIMEIEQRLSEAIYAACFGYKSPKQALDDAVPAVYAVLAEQHSQRIWEPG